MLVQKCMWHAAIWLYHLHFIIRGVILVFFDNQISISGKMEQGYTRRKEKEKKHMQKTTKTLGLKKKQNEK